MKSPTHLELIETMRWSRKDARRPSGGYFLLDLHLDRLEASARFFGFSLDLAKIEMALAELEKSLMKRGEETFLVRLLMRKDGTFHLEERIIPSRMDQPVAVDISSHRVNSSDPFLYHKTTRRQLFDKERKRLTQKGLYETIFLNEKGELTQGTITNIFLDMKGPRLVTPPLECGLLPGTLRRHLLDTAKASEQVLTLEDLKQASRVFVGNSVRGLLLADVRI